MNVKELKELLNTFPEDLEIITDSCSDYGTIECAKIMKAVPAETGWIMRSHPTMSAENKARETEYVYIGEFS